MIFFKSKFVKKIFQEYHQGDKQFDPDQADILLGLIWGQSSLPGSSEDGSSRQRPLA